MISLSKFIITNLEAFQILFAKFLAASTLSGIYLISFPGAFPVTNINLKASAPYCSITSSGAITFPLDLLILYPSSPNTIPLITISSNGFLPVKARQRSVV